MIESDALPYFAGAGSKRAKLNKAIQEGKIERPETCELCGNKPGQSKTGVPLIQAHHWNGYDDAFNVWFLCASCNGYLRGERFHSGQVDKAEAWRYINRKRNHRPKVRQCKAVSQYTGERCSRRVDGGFYCFQHK